MDTRNWLWRQSSSEKSISGEAESSGSESSQSDRFCGDQALLYHKAQSPEVMSKAEEEEAVTDSLSALSEKLSNALINIQEKEDLVKQHSKVAEEAVLGWEKAEAEAVDLRKQIEILTQKNSVLDEALKECLRQLRQARKEQEQKIFDAVAKKSIEWESTKCELETQIVELQSQLLHNTSESSVGHDIQTKLEAAEKENSILILQINSLRDKLKLITHERDLSSQAAETASRQRLDSIKKVARLEEECRRLKALSHRATPGSSIYVKSTDNQSDSEESLSATENDSCKMDGGIDYDPSSPEYLGFVSKVESDKYKKEKPSVSAFISSSLEINLMDDFLEMERLAAVPQMQSGIQIDTLAQGGVISFKAELESMLSRMAELEEKLEMAEVEKMKLEMSLNACENQLKTSKIHLEKTESESKALNAKLVIETEARKYVEETNASLKTSNEHVEEMEVQISELQTLLAINSEGKHNAEVELESTSIKLKKSQGYLEKLEVELVELQKQLAIMNEAKVVAELEVGATNKNIQKSSDRLEGMERYLDELQNQLATSNEVKRMVELELEATNIKLKQSSDNLDEMETYMEHLHNQLEMANEEKKKAKVEIGTATKNKDIVESQLVAKEVEMQTLLSRIIVLEDEVQRQRRLADEAVDKCKNLDSEISRFKQHKANFGELKINQDKELAMAANKFAECQKTMASLSQQLKSLVTIEDFFID
ncbi:hypothetical protein Leryth_001988 [Lithospermum erythrorhizon]|nr:hypothetical protein Leryth_001988 [Lithospermum erythrorhizon]